MTLTRCIACDGDLHGERTLVDDRYGCAGQYVLMTCGACGHRTLDVQMDATQLANLYTHYYPRSSFDVEAWTVPQPEGRIRTWWRGLRASAFRWVPTGVRVLDIGCGFGETLGYHRARGCDAHGVEADRNIERVALRHGLNVRVGLFDATQYEPASFNVVTLDQVIEHLSDPLGVLDGVRKVLRPDGLLIVSTPNADGWGTRFFGQRWIHWHAPYHQQFFSAKSMEECARRTGFDLVRRTTVTNSAWLDFQWAHLVTYPHAGTPSTYWSPAGRRTLPQRAALKVLRAFDRIGLNAAITRSMDALGVGDNVVYLLRGRGG